MISFFDGGAPLVLDRPTEAATAECPDCCGNGVLFVRRQFGPNASEPYVTRQCSACSGTGEVPADAVVYCVECSTPVWADQVCAHQLGAVCSDHAAACHECTGVRGDR